MRKLCKNCESFASEDGKAWCNYLNVERTDRDNPPYESICWKPRPRLSGDALSLARSEAGKLGGRKKGYGRGRAPTKQASLRLLDHNVLMAYSQMKKQSFAQTIHIVCNNLIKNYPNLRPDGWVD